jgi:hypothetical protein
MPHKSVLPTSYKFSSTFLSLLSFSSVFVVQNHILFLRTPSYREFLVILSHFESNATVQLGRESDFPRTVPGSADCQSEEMFFGTGFQKWYIIRAERIMQSI